MRAFVIIAVAVCVGAGKALARTVPAFPSDLGATVIDVSGYPAEQQRTYHDLFQTKCVFCHTAARAVNAPCVELPAGEAARFARKHPELEGRADVLAASPDVWRDYMQRMWHRPPCCNRCPTFTREEAERLWRFLVFDSIERKTGARLAAWIRLRERLNAQFQTLREDPDADPVRGSAAAPASGVVARGRDAARRDRGSDEGP